MDQSSHIFRVILKDSTLPHESGSFWQFLKQVVNHYYDFYFDGYLYVIIPHDFAEDFRVFCCKYKINNIECDLMFSSSCQFNYI